MRRRKGSVLATVLMLALFLVIITAVVANNALANYKSTNWATDTGSSRYVAYAGIQHALIRLKDEPTYNNAGQAPLTGNIPNHPELRYEVVVKNQRDLVPAAQPGGSRTLPFALREVPANCARLESKVISSDGKTERVLTGMVGTAVWSPTAFENAANARSMLMMQDNTRTMAFDFHSYDADERWNAKTDSLTGYQDPAASQGPGGGGEGDDDDSGGGGSETKGRADVQTEQMVQIGGSAKVEGNVIKPQEESSESESPAAQQAAIERARLNQALSKIAPDLAQALPESPSPGSKGTNYTGDIKPLTGRPENAPADPPYNRDEATEVRDDFPGQVQYGYDGKPVKDMNGNVVREPETLQPKAYKSVSVPSGQTLRLRPGRYYFADDFQVSGKIEVVGGDMDDIVVYVGKKMVVNGEINFAGDPAKLQVYFTDEDYPVAANGTPLKEVDEDGRPVRGFSTLEMNSGAKATMVVEGANLISKLKDDARLLGAVSAMAIWLRGNSRIEYDTNLKGRQVAGGSPWKLQGVYETVLK